mmetsp:Transcript_28144/g.52832  ORF Transcript_28144/g.52832 Transcript_28144/m.52832 type:complete len:84 (+) Transcript_28144:430-681(+)
MVYRVCTGTNEGLVKTHDNTNISEGAESAYLLSFVSTTSNKTNNTFVLFAMLFCVIRIVAVGRDKGRAKKRLKQDGVQSVYLY